MNEIIHKYIRKKNVFCEEISQRLAQYSNEKRLAR